MNEPKKRSPTRKKATRDSAPQDTPSSSVPQPQPAVVPGPVVGQPVPIILGHAGVPVGVGAQLQIQQTQVWQSPYPPPEAAERFEKLCPGAFNRMLTMGEKAQDASIEANKQARDSLKADTLRGHWLGWLATIGAIGGACFCAYIGQPWVAGALVGVPVLSVCKALVDATKAKSVPIIAAQPSATPAAGDQRTGKEAK